MRDIRRKKLTCYLCTTAAVTVGLVLLIVILGLTVFKPKHPITTVDSIDLADLDFSIDAPRFRVYLNLSLNTDLAVKNPNRVGFKYKNSTALLRYRGNDVGSAAIPAGKIGGRSSGDLNVTLTIMADRLVFDREFYSDVVSGELGFEVHVKLKGKVRVLFEFGVVAYADCDVVIGIMSRSVVNQTCRYKTKL